MTLGVSEKERLAQDEALSDAGFYGAIHRSLQQHGYELGQYPVTSFVGYGALQQIAQNGMIRACVQTVADDITREWITITGDDAEAVEEIQTLQEKKYHLRKLFHEAATLTGYMGGAFIYVDTGTENPELPLRYSNESAELQPGKKLRFVVVDPVNVSPGDYNAIDPLKPDYLKPRYFWVLGTKVHESRLLRLFDNPPADASATGIQLPRHSAGSDPLGLRDALESVPGLYGRLGAQGLASRFPDEHG